jgi:hypothetical protein
MRFDNVPLEFVHALDFVSSAYCLLPLPLLLLMELVSVLCFRCCFLTIYIVRSAQTCFEHVGIGVGVHLYYICGWG